MATTFGIEEEFVILDPASLAPIDRGPDAIADLECVAFVGNVSSTGDAGAVVPEFFRSQLEYASAVCGTAEEALQDLREFRHRLGAWSTEEGVIAAGTGTPYRLAPRARLSAGDRYTRIADDVAGLTADHQINSTHVHIGVPDREAGVTASNRLRPWLPALLAMSANSPFWGGADTGYDSWRALHSRRWTTYGVPPHFTDAAHYAETVESLAGIGATSDEGTINWNIRLCRHQSTVEVRVFDAQLDAESSVALAVIVRALATTPAPWAGTVAPHLLDAGLWHAARYGIRRGVLHPAAGRLQPADDVAAFLRQHTAAALHRTGDTDVVDRFMAQVMGVGTGASVQRRALRAGTPALGELYRTRLAGARTVPRASADRNPLARTRRTADTGPAGAEMSARRQEQA